AVTGRRRGARSVLRARGDARQRRRGRRGRARVGTCRELGSDGGGCVMRHPTYKHLEARLRLGAFSLGQWAQITAAGAAAAVFGGYLSPFSTQVTIFVSIVGAGLPIARPDNGSSHAGDLCAVEAIDREGLVVTREGALVRFLRAAPKNPLVMSPVEREQVGHAFGQLAGRLQAGQSIQFYVEALPIRLDALLDRSQQEAERTIRALASDGDRAGALRRLHAALRE